MTCYQQSEVVLLALESVKYQILHYGQGQKFQLIAADDASTDGSQELIRAWAAENQALFARITLLFREKNGGICRNYVDALRAVEGERFVKVDGDDLLSSMTVKNVKTGELTVVEADEEDGLFGLFGFIGYNPNSKLFEGMLEMENGYIRTDDNMHTNIPGVFAAGDIRVKSLRQVVTAAADGAIAAMQAEHYISNH